MKVFAESLPEEYKERFFLPNVQRWASINRWQDFVHDWYTIPAYMILNKEGLKFFQNVNYVNVFRCPANYIGPIHEDRQTTTAINWIIQGEGIHQWFHPNDCKVIRLNRADNAIYDAGDNKPIFETDMKFMKAYTHIPHRVICTSDIDRICISVRTTERHEFNFD
jgi:hypothetical protein